MEVMGTLPEVVEVLCLKSFEFNWSFLVMFRARKLGAPVMPILENLKFSLCDSLLEDLCVLYCQNISWLLSMIGWNHLPSLKYVRYSTPNSGPGGRELRVLSQAPVLISTVPPL